MESKILVGDCLERLKEIPDCSVDSVVTDPPYGLSFMGKRWDYDVPSVEVWAECLRVLKPGGHMLAFAGTRTQHRMAVRIEDAGFEIRDMIAWVYGSGFPKSLDVSKAIDKAADYKLQSAYRRAYVEAVQEAGLALPGNSRHDWTVGEHAPGDMWWAEFERWLPGLSDAERERVDRIVVGKGLKPRPTLHTGSIGSVAEANQYDITAPATDAARQWAGWGTALKPALEPITVARKPLAGTVAENVLQHGTGALNIDGCRVNPTGESRERVGEPSQERRYTDAGSTNFAAMPGIRGGDPSGRWPANLIHDGSEEVTSLFPTTMSASEKYGTRSSSTAIFGSGQKIQKTDARGGSGIGSAARFFYCAKASKADRGEGNIHPTVKPTDLMRYLCRLVTPPGGLVLDPFMGSGSTGKAASLEGFRFVGIEREAQYAQIAESRISAVSPLFHEVGLHAPARSV